MVKHNAANERIKRDYLRFLEQAKGRDIVTVDKVAASIAKFESSTRFKDFKRFHREQAMAFKRQLNDSLNSRTGEKLSKATIKSILRDLKAFFEWLSREPGYRSKIDYSDADYFNQNEKDAAIANGRREKRVPTIQQVERVLTAMPSDTRIDRRNRALIAFTLITAARVGALGTLKLEHINLDEACAYQDVRAVKTKFAKSFRTYFMPVSKPAAEIVRTWVTELRDVHLFGDSDPLFPATAIRVGASGGFEAQGLSRLHWATSEPIRQIFRKAFEAAALPYFNPHSFRDMLVRHAMAQNLTPEAMKAWSQNLGHNEVMTTLTSYGAVPTHRQGELVRNSFQTTDVDPLDNPTVRSLLKQLQAGT